MFLIFSLGRLDVFPHDDLGVRTASLQESLSKIEDKKMQEIVKRLKLEQEADYLAWAGGIEPEGNKIMKHKSKYKYAISRHRLQDQTLRAENRRGDGDDLRSTVFEPGMNGLVKLLWEPPLANEWHEYGDMYVAVASLLAMLIVKGVLKGKWLQRTTRATISAYSRLYAPRTRRVRPRAH